LGRVLIMNATTTRRDKKTQAISLLTGEGRAWRVAGFAPTVLADTTRGLVEGVVLAGVHTWGHSALDHVACWPLVPVAGQPLLFHTIRWLGAAGIRNTNICANSDTLSVSRTLRDGRTCGMSLEYYEDRMPRGPAGCIRDVMTLRQASVYVVVDGSVLPGIDLSALLDAHQRSGAVLTVAATRTGGSLASHQRLSPAGIYVFSSQVADHISSAGYQDIKEKLIPRLHAKGLPVATHLVDNGALPRVRCAASYLTVNKWATEITSRKRLLPPEYRSVAESCVHQTSAIDAGARLIGPVIIGEECVVESGAVIVGPTTIGRGSRIRSGAAISRSAVWSSCRIGAGAIVDDCVVADNVSIDDGAIQRNAVCATSGR
jgi:NDP-sugar pyrophosphorylase family protein